ncbi:MAG: dephospho-CoA kinase, partial [Deltaproteobacteria bacterium]|nr:dephospho-CoA kinase [Deltaproteobacteria bacterium]MBL7175723.1 dephospho-CoA kinase [Desulfobacteraceae bacterium]
MNTTRDWEKPIRRMEFLMRLKSFPVAFKLLEDKEALYRRGIRYPISYAGAETDVTNAFPEPYGGEGMVKRVRGKDNRIVLGVTGSIATGKTIVAKMLEELGARTIDFDVLSRVVVEPGKPAWKDIVAYFGEQVLLEDKTLDRNKLREIVFRDFEKRKKLEDFQHPRIYEEFFKLVDQYAQEDPDVVMQGVVPLLIEVNLQPFFHNLLMVYAPEEIQIKRLIERDGMTKEMAINMVRSQLSVEEKKGYCDLIIDNSGSLDETRKQVGALWAQLKKIQQDQKARSEEG